MQKSEIKYGSESRIEEGISLKLLKFCKFEAKNWAAEKRKTKAALKKIFLLPKKTIASAIQPVPLEIEGTKEFSLKEKTQPAKVAKNAAKAQLEFLRAFVEIFFDSRNASFFPQILK